MTTAIPKRWSTTWTKMSFSFLRKKLVLDRRCSRAQWRLLPSLLRGLKVIIQLLLVYKKTLAFAANNPSGAGNGPPGEQQHTTTSTFHIPNAINVQAPVVPSSLAGHLRSGTPSIASSSQASTPGLLERPPNRQGPRLHDLRRSNTPSSLCAAGQNMVAGGGGSSSGAATMGKNMPLPPATNPPPLYPAGAGGLAEITMANFEGLRLTNNAANYSDRPGSSRQSLMSASQRPTSPAPSSEQGGANRSPARSITSGGSTSNAGFCMPMLPPRAPSPWGPLIEKLEAQAAGEELMMVRGTACGSTTAMASSSSPSPSPPIIGLQGHPPLDEDRDPSTSSLQHQQTSGSLPFSPLASTTIIQTPGCGGGTVVYLPANSSSRASTSAGTRPSRARAAAGLGSTRGGPSREHLVLGGTQTGSGGATGSGVDREISSLSGGPELMLMSSSCSSTTDKSTSDVGGAGAGISPQSPSGGAIGGLHRGNSNAVSTPSLFSQAQALLSRTVGAATGSSRSHAKNTTSYLPPQSLVLPGGSSHYIPTTAATTTSRGYRIGSQSYQVGGPERPQHTTPIVEEEGQSSDTRSRRIPSSAVIPVVVSPACGADDDDEPRWYLDTSREKPHAVEGPGVDHAGGNYVNHFASPRSPDSRALLDMIRKASDEDIIGEDVSILHGGGGGGPLSGGERLLGYPQHHPVVQLSPVLHERGVGVDVDATSTGERSKSGPGLHPFSHAQEEEQELPEREVHSMQLDQVAASSALPASPTSEDHTTSYLQLYLEGRQGFTTKNTSSAAGGKGIMIGGVSNNDVEDQTSHLSVSSPALLSKKMSSTRTESTTASPVLHTTSTTTTPPPGLSAMDPVGESSPFSSPVPSAMAAPAVDDSNTTVTTRASIYLRPRPPTPPAAQRRGERRSKTLGSLPTVHPLLLNLQDHLDRSTSDDLGLSHNSLPSASTSSLGRVGVGGGAEMRTRSMPSSGILKEHMPSGILKEHIKEHIGGIASGPRGGMDLPVSLGQGDLRNRPQQRQHLQSSPYNSPQQQGISTSAIFGTGRSREINVPGTSGTGRGHHNQIICGGAGGSGGSMSSGRTSNPGTSTSQLRRHTGPKVRRSSAVPRSSARRDSDTALFSRQGTAAMVDEIDSFLRNANSGADLGGCDQTVLVAESSTSGRRDEVGEAGGGGGISVLSPRSCTGVVATSCTSPGQEGAGRGITSAGGAAGRGTGGTGSYTEGAVPAVPPCCSVMKRPKSRQGVVNYSEEIIGEAGTTTRSGPPNPYDGVDIKLNLVNQQVEVTTLVSSSTGGTGTGSRTQTRDDDLVCQARDGGHQEVDADQHLLPGVVVAQDEPPRGLDPRVEATSRTPPSCIHASTSTVPGTTAGGGDIQHRGSPALHTMQPSPRPISDITTRTLRVPSSPGLLDVERHSSPGASGGASARPSAPRLGHRRDDPTSSSCTLTATAATVAGSTPSCPAAGGPSCNKDVHVHVLPEDHVVRGLPAGSEKRVDFYDDESCDESDDGDDVEYLHVSSQHPRSRPLPFGATTGSASASSNSRKSCAGACSGSGRANAGSGGSDQPYQNQSQQWPAARASTPYAAILEEQDDRNRKDSESSSALGNVVSLVLPKLTLAQTSHGCGSYPYPVSVTSPGGVVGPSASAGLELPTTGSVSGSPQQLQLPSDRRDRDRPCTASRAGRPASVVPPINHPTGYLPPATARDPDQEASSEDRGGAPRGPRVPPLLGYNQPGG
ncbi:unnamed protein product [Amoebophrya sp. A25]|nr:unnamed protein product [Amoebophrya sp. A25]|eukprot:GSA25T00012845001.1